MTQEASRGATRHREREREMISNERLNDMMKNTPKWRCAGSQGTPEQFYSGPVKMNTDLAPMTAMLQSLKLN